MKSRGIGLPFELAFAGPAAKFLKKAEKKLHDRIIQKLNKLADEPFPPDAKRVVGRQEKVFRIRVGDYRILYVVYFEEKTILVADIDKRSRIY
jgi:mRNA interferase RelE/StbE